MVQPNIFSIDDKCTGCGACVSVCPKGCLSLDSDTEGFYYPNLKDGCISCKLCEKVCHVLHPENKKVIKADNVFVYHSSQNKIRESSSSGGAFSLFAEYIIKERGIVYSTLFNPKTYRVEVANSDLFPLSKFRKSKYVESFSGTTCKLICDELKTGRIVLFCGTPCQVSGLKQFLYTLKIDTTKLFTIDFICHGVPSSKCFSTFLSRHKHKIIDVDFRYKDFSRKDIGWHNMVYCEYYDDGSKKVFTNKDLHYYYYYYPFLQSLNLRKCCYKCDEINNSSADITIADFWTIHKIDTVKDDNKGISIVVIHSDKALELWNIQKKTGFNAKIPFDVIKSQLSNKNTKLVNKRNQFFESVKEKGYFATVRRLYFFKYVKFKIRLIGHSIKKHLVWR